MSRSTYTAEQGISRFEAVSTDLDQAIHSRLILILSALESGDVQAGLAYIKGLIGKMNRNPSDEWVNNGDHGDDNVVPMQKVKPVQPRTESSNHPVTIFTLGRFAVLKQGKPLQFRTKAQKKPLDLLKVIISLGGRSVSKLHITELLWPDSEGDASISVVNTTLSRLRKLIGKEAILTESGRVTLNPEVCRVDCWDLEKSLNAIRANDHDREDAGKYVRQALGYYQGSFLAGEDDGWSVSRRERIRSRFLHTLAHHGQLLMATGNCECAIALYTKVLEIDDLNEEFYLNLMRCQINLGRIADAMRVYQRCKQTINETLGIEPSLEVTALYRLMTEKN